jgi:hypothetical protein
VDSIKSQYSRVLLVDGGGFFPEDDLHKPYAWFLMDAMKMLGTDAVAVGDRDLRFGYAFLKNRAEFNKLPLVCANLYDKATRKPAFRPWIVRDLGGVKAGIFGLMSDKPDIGPARDSLYVVEPSNAAALAIAEMRKKGAKVIVLLSQLGKVESEDLVATVDGVDALIAGRNVPMLQTGRLIKNTMACYGGEQGQYVGRTIVTIDKSGRPTARENEMFILGPEVGEKQQVLDVVRQFEDQYNADLARREKEIAAKTAFADSTQNAPDHFLGTEVCVRCHQAEGEQWKTTPHARAWQTLVDAKKDATPECISCHVVGHKLAGGFNSMVSSPGMVNVGCESCHGMGTRHDAFVANPQKVNETACLSCHTASTSPDFNFARFKPYVDHGRRFDELPPLNTRKPMKAAAMH